MCITNRSFLGPSDTWLSVERSPVYYNVLQQVWSKVGDERRVQKTRMSLSVLCRFKKQCSCMFGAVLGAHNLMA